MSVKLKLLRLQSGMTLEALAQAAELTRSYVSKLERGISEPSIGAALRLAKALGVTVDELFSASPEHDPVVVNRASAQAPSPPGTPRLISGNLPGHRMVAFVITPSEAPQHDHPMSHHHGEEILYVIKGNIRLQLAGRTEALGPGDSVHFNASIPHKITAVGKRPASVLLVISQENDSA